MNDKNRFYRSELRTLYYSFDCDFEKFLDTVSDMIGNSKDEIDRLTQKVNYLLSENQIDNDES